MRKESEVDIQRTMPSGYPTCESLHRVLDDMRQRRWMLAGEAMKGYSALQQRLTHPERTTAELQFREAPNLYPDMPEHVQDKFRRKIAVAMAGVSGLSEGMVIIPEELVVDHPRNWPGDDLMCQLQGSMMTMTMWLASTVYGAIHLAGWNDLFPSVVEKWLWRTSSAYVVFSGLLWAFLNILDFLSGSVWLYWFETLAGVQRKSHMLIYGLCVVGGLLYVVARTFLVAEAFISLRALPAAAYVSPSWVLTVPHL